MKYAAAFFGVVFLLFAYWQINDPDPVWWITLYAVLVYASVQVFRGRYNAELFGVLAVLYAAGALNLWLQMTGWEGFFTKGEGLTMKTPNQELARESAGMGIAFAVLLLYAVAALPKKNKSKSV